MKNSASESDSIREAIALLKLLELSEADVEAGRLATTEEAFERARRAIAEREEKTTR